MSAPNSATASLKATTACGRSSAPLWDAEAKALAGNAADSGSGSLLRMVPVATPSSPLILAPSGFDSRSVKVSPSSSWASSKSGTDTVRSRSSGLNRSAPLVSV